MCRLDEGGQEEMMSVSYVVVHLVKFIVGSESNFSLLVLLGDLDTVPPTRFLVCGLIAFKFHFDD